jgi:hypothetical protein
MWRIESRLYIQQLALAKHASPHPVRHNCQTVRRNSTKQVPWPVNKSLIVTSVAKAWEAVQAGINLLSYIVSYPR